MPGAFIASDLIVMLSETDFGVTATYAGGTVPGIFDKGDVEVDSGEGFTKIVKEYSFTGRSADFPSIADGDVMVIGGVSYLIRRWIDDGTGEIEIIMEPA